MILPDPVNIGYPNRGKPELIGKISGHGQTREFCIGERILYGGEILVVNVTYIPSGERPFFEALLVPSSWAGCEHEPKLKKVSAQMDFGF